MKLILHPGFAKCGSTSIQNALSINQKDLGNQGFYVVTKTFIRNFATKYSSGVKHFSVLQYFKYIRTQERYVEFENAIKALKRWAKKKGFTGIIISSENLIMRDVKFHQILSNHFSEVQVAIYIRRQDDWILSAWKQWNHIQGKSLALTIDFYLKKGKPKYKPAVDFFTELYGDENVEVRFLDRRTLKNGDLVQDFFSFTDLSLDNLQISKLSNKSSNTFLYEIFYRISHLYDFRSDEWLTRSLKNKIHSRNHILDKSRSSRFSYSQRKRIMDFYLEDNKHLHQNYFSDFDFQDLFGVEENKNEEMQMLRHEIENIKDMLAIQMELSMKHEYRKTQRIRKLKRLLEGINLHDVIKFLKKYRRH